MIKIEDVTPGADSKVDGVEAADAAARERAKERTRGPPLRFTDLEIPIGAELEYTAGDVTATVISVNTVDYDGEEYRLTPLTKQLKGTDKAVAPAYHWRYGGRLLRDIYKEVWWEE